MKKILLSIFIVSCSVAAEWVTGPRGATIESASSDAKKFVSLLFSEGVIPAATSLYDDLPAEKFAAFKAHLKANPPSEEITGEAKLVEDVIAGAFRTNSRQRMVESRAIESKVAGEKVYRFVFSIKPKSKEAFYIVVHLTYAGFGTIHGRRNWSVELSAKKPESTVAATERRPNQSPEPTSMSVTTCADAQLAPATLVAHL